MEKALSEKIYGRVVDAGYYRPNPGSIYYRPNYQASYYPAYHHNYGLPLDLETSISSVLGFHDHIGAYERTHDIVNHVADPAVTEILGAMYDVMQKNKAKEGEKKEGDKKEEPAKQALHQVGSNNQNMVYQEIYQKEMMNASGISEEALNKLVDAAIQNAKNRPPQDKDANSKDAQMRAVEAILADKIYNRVITEGYYRPTWRSSYYRPNYPTYHNSYLDSTIGYDINRLINYHEYTNRYGHVNNVL